MKTNFNLVIITLFCISSSTGCSSGLSPKLTRPKLTRDDIKRLIWSGRLEEVLPYAHDFIEITPSCSKTPLGIALECKEPSAFNCIKFLLEHGVDASSLVSITHKVRFVKSGFFRRTHTVEVTKGGKEGRCASALWELLLGGYDRMRGWQLGEYKVTDAVKFILAHHNKPSFAVAEDFLPVDLRGYDNPDPLNRLQKRKQHLDLNPLVMAFCERQYLNEMVPLLEEHIEQNNRWLPARSAWCVAVIRGVLVKSGSSTAANGTGRGLETPATSVVPAVPTVGKPSACCRELM